MKYHWLFVCACILLVSSCGSVDLAFVNQVKRFEPRWMELSEKVSYIDRYLNVTQRRYTKDLEAVNARLARSGSGSQSSAIHSLKTRYGNIMDERDELKSSFDLLKERFTVKVHDFNEWENKLMKNKLPSDQAKADFVQFKDDYESLREDVELSQTEIIRNIDAHNSVMRDLSRRLSMYTNFDIDLK